MESKQKTVLATGASSGIGLLVANSFEKSILKSVNASK